MHRRSKVRLAAVVLAALIALPGIDASTTSAAGPPPEPGLVGRQTIVQWRPAATTAQRTMALRAVGALDRKTLNPSEAATAPVEVVSFPSNSSRDDALQGLAADPAVQSVEPNRPLHVSGRPAKSFNDPLLADGTQWHLLGARSTPRNRFGVDAVDAFRAGNLGDPNVYVGVVDDGVDISHPDLAANVFTNRWDPPNGIDDDHNGFVDDVHGWDFYNGDASVFDGQEHFDFIDAHGTVVAGEIAGVQGNGIGGSGAAPRVKVIPAKFLGPEEGTTAGAIAALDYLTDLKLRHHLNIVASNNSWEGDDEDSQALQAAIQRGADADILFVTIAGNGDWDTGEGYDVDARPNYPASLHCRLRSGGDCMIVTTAITSEGQMPSWANWGRRTVDIGAPGELVWSTFPFNDYQAYDGTSQAAPLVSSAIALYRSKYRYASPAQARRAILASAVPTPSLRGKTVTGARLDIARALANDRGAAR